MKLLPFNSVERCSACGNLVEGYTVKYSTSIQMPAGDGRFVDLSKVGDAPQPHLEKHCPHCGFGWLEDTQLNLSKE